ncbi:MAG: DNA polymerase IV [Alphaproteobacteria bacterium]|nr:DNA polymerase IV [Alphaproteobacteria bacterium]MCW5741665.1 DNA polymerase IV [Alphaproteobacteria bacterium]
MAQAAIRKIIHVDMDAFFASVEQRDNPELRGKPVAVGGSTRRGVVAAASYEARVFGVRSAMPSLTAQRLCPDLIFVKPRFEVYRAVSQQIRAIFLEYTPLVEPLSLDEAYLDVTENLKGVESATATARAIRAAIREQTGLNASAGISYNKFLAKQASDHNKPNGQYTITPDMGEAFVAGLKIGKFHGVGPATAAKMERLGISTGADLRRQSLAFLTEHFGKAGPRFFAIARGEDQRQVTPDRERKSVGSESTYFDDLTTPQEVERAILEQLDDVWKYVERNGIAGRTLTIKIRYRDFEQHTRSRSAPMAIHSKGDAAEVVLGLVRGAFPLVKPVRLLGVTLHNLDRPDAEAPAEQQMSLELK